MSVIKLLRTGMRLSSAVSVVVAADDDDDDDDPASAVSLLLSVFFLNRDLDDNTLTAKSATALTMEMRFSGVSGCKLG